jgi:esterase/lipase superfamily enzyme
LDERGHVVVRRVFLIFLALAGLGGLAGCVSLQQVSLSGPLSPELETETLFVASMRARDQNGHFGPGRASGVSYSSFQVSVPPDRALGTIPFATGKGDPSVDFVTLGERRFADGAAFARAAVARGDVTEDPARQAVIFVHGFNTNFDETLYRLAQIGHDFHMPGAKVLFAWPTRHRLSLYVHDEDSAAIARDGLEALLKTLAAGGFSRIVILGHSKGAQIVVETLRQMRIDGGSEVFARLGGVYLLSPDMDTDLFIEDAGRIAPLPQPFVIFGSKNDYPLTGFANVFAAGNPRLGALPDPSVLARFKLTYLDVSSFAGKDRSDEHLPMATSPTLINLINTIPDSDLGQLGPRLEAGLLPGTQVRHIGAMTSIVMPSPPPGTIR